MNICQQIFSVIDILSQITPNYFLKCHLTKYAKYDKLFSGNDVLCYTKTKNQHANTCKPPKVGKFKFMAPERRNKRQNVDFSL